MNKALVPLALLTVFLAGCGVSQKKFDELKKENEALKQELAALKKGQQINAKKGKLLLTMQSMKDISGALGSYLVDYNVVPESLSDVGKFYIKEMPPADGWGNAWRYFRYGQDRDEYILMSAGPDGIFSWNPTNGKYAIDAMPKMFGDDIVLRNGVFVAGPVSGEKSLASEKKE